MNGGPRTANSRPRPPKVAWESLRIENFRETRDVVSFDCGSKELNDFLCTEEVSEYTREGLGKTYLVYLQEEGRLVAYFTICADSLRVEYLKTVKSFSKFAAMKMDAIPGVKIGRLAVDKEYKFRDIGSHLMRYIGGLALATPMAARLLIVQAKPTSVEFYQKFGFEFVTETKRERKRENKTMFLDLWTLAQVERSE
jgi:predicted GNAT family N-acyltransferase